MRKFNLKYELLLGLLRGIANLPLSVLYRISDCLSFFTHRILKYRVTIVRENLRNSFPEKDIRELKKIEKKFYRHLCDVIVESIKLLKISDKTLSKRVKVINPEVVQTALDSSNIVILFLGHYANWEWVPFLTHYFDKDIEMGSLYQPLHSKLMNEIMKKIRSRHGIELIESRNAYRRMVEKKQSQRKFMVGFIGDQRPLNSKQKNDVVFLNQPTDTLVGGETIGKKIGSKFLFLDINSKKRGYYDLTFKEMDVTKYFSHKESYPHTHLFYKYLETSIRSNPHLWLWSHNRWNLPKRK